MDEVTLSFLEVPQNRDKERVLVSGIPSLSDQGVRLATTAACTSGKSVRIKGARGNALYRVVNEGTGIDFCLQYFLSILVLMLKFSPKIKKSTSNEDTLRSFKDVESLHGKACDLLRSHLRGEEISQQAKVPYKVVTLSQLSLRRGIELTEGVVREINSHAVINGVVLARALLETACLLCHASEKVTRFINEALLDNVSDLNEQIEKMLLGSRISRYTQRADLQSPDAINILTIINRMEKESPGLRELYSDLCDVAHPNISGVSLPYTAIDMPGRQQAFHGSWETRETFLPQAVHTAGLSLTLIISQVERIEQALPDLIQLCETHLSNLGESHGPVP
jgi:hypothetical protein